MAEGETEKEYNTRIAFQELRERFEGLTTALKQSPDSPLEATLRFCQEFCQVLVEHASRWQTDEDPLPQLQVYTTAILNFAKAVSNLSPECENVPLLLEKLAQSCVELLLLLPQHVPGALWEEFQSSIKMAHNLLQESGSSQLSLLAVLAQQEGVWSNTTLCSILANETSQTDKVHKYLEFEGPKLLIMRIKHLIKMDSVDKAAALAKTCSEYPGFEGKGNFKQSYLLCICVTKNQEQLMDEIASIDCKEALEMICNLESEGDENGALSICSAFLKRQLLQGDVYCAWELTLLWSKLLIRRESSADGFLSRCKDMALLCRSVCHILFLIKVIQSEIGEVGLPVCVEMCIQALKMSSSDHKESKSTICKTISCLLPNDLEVKRACQLTEFLIHPTVDTYYAVETSYNEPDKKPEEDEGHPMPNSLRCELLLALKTQWPFDPEFWDWKTLKRNCLVLMGDEAAIVSSIDTLNDTDEQEVEGGHGKHPEYKDLEDFMLTTTNELNEIADEKEKNREAKKLREQGFVSARFRNWRAYMQYCVLCDKEFLGHRIVRHAQKHFKDGMFLCPICATSYESKEVLEPHVASHVKQSCKERLAAMKASRKSANPHQSPLQNTTNNLIKPELESQLENKAVNLEQAPADPSQDCFCPVTNCAKAFKFFRNLMAHVRSHKDDEEAMRFLEIQKQKVVCQYCRRQFVNVQHLNDHLQIHCGTRPYICIQLDCKATFNSNSELLMHRKVHPEFKAKCMFPNCGQIFSEAYLLYDHEAQHYLTYTCSTDNCGRIFYSQEQFLSHQQVHNPYAPANVTTETSSKTQQSNSCKQEKEDTLLARGYPEKSNSNTPTDQTQASTTPCTTPDFVKEPVKVKHSIESMLNRMAETEGTEPDKCNTPLTNPTPVSPELNAVPEIHQADYRAAEGGNLPPPYPGAVNTMDVQQGEMLNNEFDKTIPQTIALDQIKTEVPYSLQDYVPSTHPSNSDENLYSCPFSDCGRSYSTNKSLSRHVKKQHPEIFEDWKLAKKYNKVAKIASKKAPVPSLSPNHSPLGKRSVTQSGLQCTKPEMQHGDYHPGCSSSFNQCYSNSMEPVPITPMVNPSLYPSWGSHTGMQQNMSQPWSSPPMNNCYSDPINLGDYPTRSYSHWQQDLYPTTSEKDSAATVQDSTVSHSPCDSSLMSQYLSSSLMLDNGGQMHNGAHQYGLVCPESSVSGTSGDVGKSSTEMNENSISTADTLNDGSYQTSHTPNSCLTQSSSGDVPAKPTSPNADKTIQPEVEKTDKSSHPLCEQLENSVDGMSPKSSHHTDDECPDDDCETSDENNKGPDDQEKSNDWSKRSKLPAIFKDGKVICKRCFREFTSTKSLGCHLSKHSECRPLDEIDLTADLPTSFLDFLNDPLVPDTNGVVCSMSNGNFSQESCNFATLSPMTLKQEPLNTYGTEYSRNQENLIELSNSFHKTESVQQKTGTNFNLEQTVLGDPTSHTRKTQGKSLEKRLKPFKCDQEECEYAFMTKEALFKHLSKMHDYTQEMIEELKRTPSKLSPYPCQICNKTFTRTTGLRIHYEKVHRLSREEMQRLKISARNRRAFKLNKNDGAISCSTPSISTSQKITPNNAVIAVKPELLDIAIGSATDEEPAADIFTGQRDGRKVAPEASTVTQLPSPPNYFNDLTVPIVPLDEPETAVITTPDSESTVSTMKSPGGTKEKKRQSDWSLYNIKENITNAGYSSPEKPSSSKNIQNNCETSKKETVQKKLGPKMYELDVYSPYRPYRCVHEGCTAAFTIQQNLILHYRAMHQESLNLCNTEAEGEADNYTDSIEKETEVRCQVKNCSRVFEGITTLVQHYLLLHKFSRDKATSMMASMNIGTFNCDRPECALPFDSVEGYIEHIKNFHKEIAISESGSVDITFKCEYEGCDRVYSTKSNLLRHLIKKHDFVYDPKINDGRRTKSVGLIPASCNEKENVEKTSKAKTKNIVKSKEGKLPVQWTSFENMNLKSKEEASAMCIKNFVVQYPCMIVGCDATTRAERDIHRHYTLHGLAEKTIEEHRGQLIFCRKYIRTLPKDTIKCEGPSGSSEESDHKNGENHFEEKPVECMDSQSQEDANVKDNLAEIPSSTGTKVKRGRPKKTSQTMPMFPQRMRTLRNRTTVHNWRERLQPGLEGTFLKFLKTSDTAQASKRKLNDGSNCDIPSKRQPTQKHKSAIKLKMKYKLAHRGKDCNILVDFRNPVKLKLVNNVKIVLDNTFSNSADVLLKQLQEMKPLVVIKKLISSWS
ncbi:zinc finger protein 292a [Periophthalmus magnuspinnatus]|uniref:zinc finger protein 292a n=1 Tax=Periophthalmus magnuspinnatus TaxID=409849 RepID=UPI00145BBDB9|nr:zinc finger protein 292a [Periophthalmus magnuspinnatus]